MSALRLGRLPDGTRHVVVIDDGACPAHHNKGIRGATFENPVQVNRAVGESQRTRADRLRREWAARQREAK